jgi:hypothetical protein
VSVSTRYGAASVILVAIATLLLWPFLEPSGRSGVLLAAAVAVPLQVTSFALLHRFRGELRRFLVVWVGGTLLRMVAIGTVAVLVLRSGTEGVVPTLFALAAFFFGLLLLEPVYFGKREPRAAGVQR